MKHIEAEIDSIADFGGMPKAKSGGIVLKKVLEAESGSKGSKKTADKGVAEALKDIEEATNEDSPKKDAAKNIADFADKVKDAAKELPGNSKKVAKIASEGMEEIKEAVTPKKKPAAAAPKPAPAPASDSKEDTSEISQLM